MFYAPFFLRKSKYSDAKIVLKYIGKVYSDVEGMSSDWQNRVCLQIGNLYSDVEGRSSDRQRKCIGNVFWGNKGVSLEMYKGCSHV